MDTVAPGSPAHQHHQVAGLLSASPRHTFGQQAQRPAVDQRVGHISFVKKDGAVQGGYAEAVGIVRHARPHPLEHAARV